MSRIEAFVKQVLVDHSAMAARDDAILAAHGWVALKDVDQLERGLRSSTTEGFHHALIMLVNFSCLGSGENLCPPTPAPYDR